MRVLKNQNTSRTSRSSHGQKTWFFICLCMVFVLGYFPFLPAQSCYNSPIPNTTLVSPFQKLHWHPLSTSRTLYADTLVFPMPLFFRMHPFTPNTFSRYGYSPTLPRFMDCYTLGWFCKLDLKMDLKMKVPWRFRLGETKR